MFIGWSTVSSLPDAQRLAREAIAGSHATCVQIDGPITSFYRWKDSVEETVEYRLTFKFTEEQRTALEAWLHQSHPYDTPQWVAVRAEIVGEKYLSWAQANSSNLPL